MFESLGSKGLFPPWFTTAGPLATAAVLFRLAAPVAVDVTVEIKGFLAAPAPVAGGFKLLRAPPNGGLVPTLERSGVLFDRRVTGQQMQHQSPSLCIEHLKPVQMTKTCKYLER